MELNQLDIQQAGTGLQNKKFSSTELTQACFNQIKKTDSGIKAFITKSRDRALKQAEAVDQSISQKESIPDLAGIPYAAKDNFCTQGIKTTAASKILENYIPSYESTTTSRLEQQDAVLIGKTNLDEFAMGASTQTSAFFTSRNPINTDMVAGGSSGGSAAAVAANHCIYALGSDTGGSIRQPACFCGVVGLKPTYGRTSRYGVIAMASSLDTIGCITKNVADSAIVLQYIAGRDPKDSTTSNVNLNNYSTEIKSDIKGLKIGIPKGFMDQPGLNPKLNDIFKSSISLIEKMTGNPVVPVEFISPDYMLACYYIIMPAEVSSNLARYDGIRYGYSNSGDKDDLLSHYLKTRSVGFGEEVKRRIILGTFTLSHGYYDSYYKKAIQVRDIVRHDFKHAFKQVDALICPTTPSTAFPIGQNIDDPLQMYLQDIFTIPASLAGVPAISVPNGSIDGLPTGLQIIGNWFCESTILRIAHHFENYNND